VWPHEPTRVFWSTKNVARNWAALSSSASSVVPASRRLSVHLQLAAALSALAAAPLLMASYAPARHKPVATGRIEGAVLLSPTLAARRPRFRIYSDPGPGARPPAKTGDEMKNVVIYVQHAAFVGEGEEKAVMAQDDEQFVPHILPVTRGTTVEFPNNDEVFHNVFSLSGPKTFDLGRYPKGASKSVTFDKSGSVQVFCHIHSDMSAVVLVLDNPYFATPSNAHYAIENVPPGEYTVVGWHERIKPVTRTVRVVAGETTKIDFNIPIPLPGEEGR
jgi:plastocyanin